MRGALARQAYERYARALGATELPCAFVDLDAFDANVRGLASPLAAAGKALRIATKSLRCVSLLRRASALAREVSCAEAGLLTYAATETLWLAECGFRDLLLAYPTARPGDARALAEANALGAKAAVVVDDVAQLEVLRAAARERGVILPVLVDVDVSWRPLGARWHVGVRRSPLREPGEVVALARVIADAGAELRFEGILAYEAQVAGVSDRNPMARWQAPLRRAMRRASLRDVEARRAAIVDALGAAGLGPAIVNGGGSGSARANAREAALTEVSAGSAFLCSHLFDHYDDLGASPAAFFALAVARRPGPGLVTCHGGGYVASGAAGPDRAPLPWLPEGLSLLPLEGAGEVQTPLRCEGEAPALGAPIVFRHAKAGELAEHFREYALVRGDAIVERAPTYRGEGRCFLG